MAWMVAVAVLSAAAMMVVTRWSDDLRRQSEAELLRIGNEMAGAILSYQRLSAGSIRSHPGELEDLLEDRRAFGLLRHLRRIEPDPVTRSAQWGVVRAADGGIVGVHSLSAESPMRQVPQSLEFVDLPPAQRYSDWVFSPRGGQP